MRTRNFPVGDDRGQVLILTALSMVVILGVAALSLDASFMYDKRNELHAAADAAAKSGAIEVFRNSSVTQAGLEAFADQQVGQHGFSSTRLGGNTTVTVNRPPLTGPFAGNNGYVEVIASEPTATFVGSVLGVLSMTPTARAVAGTSSGPYCIITLAPPSATPESLELGNTTLSAPNCAVGVSGDLQTDNPNSTIDAASTGVTGTCSGNACSDASQFPNMTTGVAPPSDPLAPPPGPGPSPMPMPSSCTPITLGNNATLNLTPGCYSKIDATANNITLTLSPGEYYFSGPVVIGNNVTVSGSGVLLYFGSNGVTVPQGPCLLSAAAGSGGCLNVRNGADLTLSAENPSITPGYTGILIYQEANDGLEMSFQNGGPNLDLSGAVYVPGAHVSFENAAEITSDCFLLVTYSLYMRNGNGSLNNNCSTYAGSPLLTVSLAE